MTHTTQTLPQWLHELFITAHHELETQTGHPLTGRQINDGKCREFAARVIQRTTDPAVTVQSHGLTHTWICYDGGVYDAEAYPDGVSSPDQLPIFSHPSSEFDPESVTDGFPDHFSGGHYP
jgi:hypothetical protein